METGQMVFFQELCLSYPEGEKKIREKEKGISAECLEKVFWLYLPTKKQKTVVLETS